MSEQPVYVVSEDLHVLLDRWSAERFNLVFDLPYGRIRGALEDILSFGEHRVVRVSALEMRDGIERFLEREDRPIVSVDPVYRPAQHMLQITRCVDPVTLMSHDGFHARYGFPHPDEQVARLVADLRAGHGDTPCDVVLVDDVVFSGKVVIEVIRRLAEHHIRVARVVCGIAVAEKGGNDPFQMCAALGATLDAAFSFGTDGTPRVVDEICERDFFVFSPMCGRSAVSERKNLGFPYIVPFGLAETWASLGDHAQAVSRRLIELNAHVLELMERQLGHQIRFADLERDPVRVRHPSVVSDAVLLHLRAHLL